MIQVQPNKWSCLPTAFASVMGVNISDFIKLLGHDGSEVIWSELPPPSCFRGWHIQEITIACLTLGFSLTEINKFGTSAPGVGQPTYNTDFSKFFSQCIANKYGVVAVSSSTNNGHALVFNKGHFYDPSTGKETTIKCYRIRHTLWLVNRISI